MDKRTNAGAVVALTAVVVAGGCGTTTKAAAPLTTAAAATTRNNPVSDGDFKEIVENLGYKSVTTSYDLKDQQD